MIIAVTGATGFVGRAFLDQASAEEVQIRALTRREQPSRDGTQWVRGTLSDEAALTELITGSDAVVHIAGLTNAPDPAEFEAANVTGTANVIAACKAAKVKRLIFVSSLAARQPELSAYGASKARAEDLVLTSGLEWTTIRPPAVYGPRDDDMFELFRSAKWGLVPLPPGGATSIIHVNDLAELLLALIGAQPALVRKKTFEPDDGREGGWNHKEMARAIGAALGRPVFAPSLPQSVLEFAAKADRLFRGDKAKLTADRVSYMCHPNWVSRFDKRPPEAVWMPRIPGEEGFAQTAEWYRSAGWL